MLGSLFGYVWILPHLKTFQSSGFLNVLRKANATRLARSVAAAAEEQQFCMEWKSLNLHGARYKWSYSNVMTPINGLINW